MDSATHCAELVRAGGRDGYIASLFAPDGKRPVVLALYAFDIEVSRIAASVSEPMLGAIRLQWWRETLEAIARGEAMAHPVAEELARAIKADRLPMMPLHALLDAHEADFHDHSIADVTALEAYLGHTSSAVIQLASVILAGDAARASAEAAGLAGVALGLARLVNRLARQDVIAARLLPPGFTAADARALVLQRLGEARARTATIAREALPAFLPAATADLYLANPSRAPSPLRRQLRIWWQARRERF